MSAWRDLVRAGVRPLVPYHVPPVTVEVKLDANESPYDPPPEMMAALADAVREARINRYPDPRAAKVRALIAEDLRQAPERLVLGNGGDEIISLLCATFAEPRPGAARASVVYPSPGFVMFRSSALAAGMDFVEAPLGERFLPDAGALDAAIARARPNIVFLATPNNPTGTVWPRPLVERVAAAHRDVVLVIDQAYAAYGGEDFLDLVDAYEHVAVLRTYSKVGLAGLRIGVLVARPELAYEVEKVRGPYNLGVLQQRAVELALGPFKEAVHAHVGELLAERARLEAALAKVAGIEVFPSGANLVLVRVREARRVYEALLQRSILVRLFDAGPLAGCMRITVGRPPENDRLLAALAEILT